MIEGRELYLLCSRSSGTKLGSCNKELSFTWGLGSLSLSTVTQVLDFEIQSLNFHRSCSSVGVCVVISNKELQNLSET